MRTLSALVLAFASCAYAESYAVTDATFEKEVLKADTPVIVDFYSIYCGPCMKMMPVYEESSEKYADEMKFVKLDTNENKKTTKRYSIKAIPLFIIFDNGKEISRKVGYMDKEELEKFIEDSMEN